MKSSWAANGAVDLKIVGLAPTRVSCLGVARKLQNYENGAAAHVLSVNIRRTYFTHREIGYSPPRLFRHAFFGHVAVSSAFWRRTWLM
jgi:hypothetical protein